MKSLWLFPHLCVCCAGMMLADVSSTAPATLPTVVPVMLSAKETGEKIPSKSDGTKVLDHFSAIAQ